MGVVWRARQLDLDRPVAVKILHPNLASRGDARARFVREARVAATLAHEHAVRVLDFGEAPAGLYLVMELVAGRTLRAWLEDGPLPRAEALAIALAIARVLEAAHRINLVHRDIKPENTFVDRAPTGPDVRVVDFGLAFIADPQSSIGRMTEEGILGGTPAYMSPEQARGKAVGPPSDVYSLGCTLYEMLAGRPPFLGPVAELLTRHAYAPPLTLRELELEPPIDPSLDALVLAMLGKSPPLRPTAAAVATQLAALVDGDGAGAPAGALPARALGAGPAAAGDRGARRRSGHAGARGRRRAARRADLGAGRGGRARGRRAGGRGRGVRARRHARPAARAERRSAAGDHRRGARRLRRHGRARARRLSRRAAAAGARRRAGAQAAAPGQPAPAAGDRRPARMTRAYPNGTWRAPRGSRHRARTRDA